MPAIQFISADLFKLRTEALVNTVNTVGVMGKGVALQFKKYFPENYKIYRKKAEAGNLQIGQMLVTEVQGDINHPELQCIINFPTKIHWKSNSELRYIEEGLKSLKKVIVDRQIKSIGIPALGAGNGGLNWELVKPLIETYLNNLDCQVFVCEPIIDPDKTIVLKEKEANSKLNLTSSRVLLLHFLSYLEELGSDVNEVLAVKIVYFLKKFNLGNYHQIEFVKHHYGPYSNKVGKVLDYLNGPYLSKKTIHSKPFDDINLNHQAIQAIELNSYFNEEETQKIISLKSFIEGFESSFALELLATIDYLLTINPTLSSIEIAESIALWNQRKKKIFSKEQIEIAYAHLKAHFYR